MGLDMRLHRVGDKRPPHPLLSQVHGTEGSLGWTWEIPPILSLVWDVGWR